MKKTREERNEVSTGAARNGAPEARVPQAPATPAPCCLHAEDRHHYSRHYELDYSRHYELAWCEDCPWTYEHFFHPTPPACMSEEPLSVERMPDEEFERLSRYAPEEKSVDALLDKAEAERDAAVEGSTRRDKWIVKLNDENDELKARAERLAEAIKNAPHGNDCQRLDRLRVPRLADPDPLPCTCWKAKALARAEEGKS